jgi:F-type H+-transporting ATPase subunit delta
VAGQDQTVSGVPGRYATALFELASENDAIDAVGANLTRFRNMLEGSPDLKRLVRSPVFTAGAQIAALGAVLEAARIGGLARQFILFAAQNRRLFAIADMIKSYAALVAQAKGEITAEIAAAEKLSPRHLDRLAAELKTAMGREVQISTRIDKSLIGGLIVKVGSRMVDASLRTKLQNLKIAMKGTG